MTEDQRGRQRIPESLADEPTRQRLAEIRKRTRTSLARKLKVTKETVRRSQKRVDPYITTMRHYLRRRGGDLSLIVEFPDQAPVILTGLGGDEGGKRAKKKAEHGAKCKAKTRRAA